MELGPYRVGPGGKLSYNDGSWDEFANVLFVDNPVGTGYSYVDTDSYLHELPEMADQFIIFLEKFFKIFPEYEHDDIYLAGESYAGQHLPYVAQAMLKRNKDTTTAAEHKWNLKGVLIGNGWISPLEQYQSYTEFAFAEGLIRGGTPQADQVDSALNACLTELGKPGGADRITTQACEDVLTTILQVTKEGNTCYNMYDIRLRDISPSCGMSWPPDLTNVTPYLRREDVVKALHVNQDKRTGWQECSGAVAANFRAKKSVPSRKLLPQLLEAGVPILLFSGAKDFICNHIGTENLIANMEWSGGKGFELSPGVWAPKQKWDFEGELAGIYQEARNLTYVLFYNSSHMVPYDYPRRTRDMLDRFMGVDIASIGGKPVDSQIGGEKSHPETSVGGHPNSTAAQEESQGKLHKAELQAYYRSGEAVLSVVVIAAVIIGYLYWRNRRSSRHTLHEGQLGVYAPVPNGKRRDVEAQDFDGNELQRLSKKVKAQRSTDQDPYALGSESEEDEDVGRSKHRGVT